MRESTSESVGAPHRPAPRDASRDSPQTCLDGRSSVGSETVRSAVAAGMGMLCVALLASAAAPPPARPVLTVWQQVQQQCRRLGRAPSRRVPGTVPRRVSRDVSVGRVRDRAERRGRGDGNAVRRTARLRCRAAAREAGAHGLAAGAAAVPPPGAGEARSVSVAGGAGAQPASGARRTSAIHGRFSPASAKARSRSTTASTSPPGPGTMSPRRVGPGRSGHRRPRRRLHRRPPPLPVRPHRAPGAGRRGRSSPRRRSSARCGRAGTTCTWPSSAPTARSTRSRAVTSRPIATRRRRPSRESSSPLPRGSRSRRERFSWTRADPRRRLRHARTPQPVLVEGAAGGPGARRLASHDARRRARRSQHRGRLPLRRAAAAGASPPSMPPARARTSPPSTAASTGAGRAATSSTSPRRTIDTSRLPPGRYRITVVASDTAGNVGDPDAHRQRRSHRDARARSGSGLALAARPWRRGSRTCRGRRRPAASRPSRGRRPGAASRTATPRHRPVKAGAGRRRRR